MLESNFQRVVLRLLADLGGPVSHKVAEYVKCGDMEAIANTRVSPEDYADPESFFNDYQAAELLRKVDLPGDVKKLTTRAEETFLQCEAECHVTNLRLNPFVHRVFDDAKQMALMEFFLQCKEFIGGVLGAPPMDLVPRFGKGATYNDRTPLTTVPDKMTSCPTLTHGATGLLPHIAESAWGRHALIRTVGDYQMMPVEVVRGNRFTTVAKDTTKRRGICVEPSINVSLQLAVGSTMKDRLLRCGLDLRGSFDPTGLRPSKGQARHMELARQASLDGSLATIDLSNASDTVSYNLVKLMLPSRWFELLDSLRSPYTQFRGSWYKLEKFSSMGNGFTFELETLIFSALAKACGGDVGVDTFVYGDDIICPINVAKKLLPVLAFAGFTPNKRKTFLTGSFRESCGGDYFMGQAVRPYYIKELPNEPQDWIKLANGLRRVGLANPNSVIRWHRVRSAWFRALDAIPAHIRRLRGPEQLGDLVIHDDRWQKPKFKSKAPGVWFWGCYAPIQKPVPFEHWTPEVQLAAALYGVPSEGPIPRSNVAGYKVRYVPYS